MTYLGAKRWRYSCALLGEANHSIIVARHKVREAYNQIEIYKNTHKQQQTTTTNETDQDV
jgi:hypothetical protein